MAFKRRSKISTKYSASMLSEFEPGSRNKVLKNLLAIKTVREMEDAELIGYMKAERELVHHFSHQHRFCVQDVNRIHQTFLGWIYPWAGSFRHVNLSKGGFTFASAFAISSAMRDFQRHCLAENTPCQGSDMDGIARKIAIVHVELLLIHPYREGNGRTARLLATLMSYQAGQPGIDFGFIGSSGREFERYVGAIQAGLDRDYQLMWEIVMKALRRGEDLAGRT